MRTPSLIFCFVIAGLLFGSGCGKPPAPPPDSANYGSVRDQVVQQIKTGQIKLNEAGVGTLAGDFQSASINGQVIGGQTPATGWVVAFPLQQGRAAMQCFVYIEKKAPPAGQTLQLGALAVTIGSQSEGHWYQGVLGAK
jgi:hypothetical protein